SVPLSAASRPAASSRPSQVKAITWPRAWTPASVRPAPSTTWRVPSARRASAASSSPWTVRALGWIWNPEKSVPSYSTRARYRAAGGRTPCRAFMWWLLDQLELDDRGRVALAQPDPHDPGVPGRPVGVLRGDLVEQLRHDERLVREGRHDGAPRRQVVPLGD